MGVGGWLGRGWGSNDMGMRWAGHAVCSFDTCGGMWRWLLLHARMLDVFVLQVHAKFMNGTRHGSRCGARPSQAGLGWAGPGWAG